MRGCMLVLAAIALFAVAGAHEDGPDNLALHAEHFPHTQGSKSAIYQFQIDNNNAKAKQSSSVEFTAEISPDMDIENAYFYNEQSQSKPGVKAQKDIRKRFPGARITFPKLIRCNMHHINDFATVYVHAKAGKHLKEIPADDMIKASFAQNNERKESIELPLIDPAHSDEMFE